jgi:hypothetical protein
MPACSERPVQSGLGPRIAPDRSPGREIGQYVEELPAPVVR